MYRRVVSEWVAAFPDAAAPGMRGQVLGRRTRLAALAMALGTGACTATPWDFPVPTMIGNEQGVAMTGIMKTDSEDEVRRRLAQRMKCPGQLQFASLTTQRADNMLGTKMLLYKAVIKCGGVSPSTTSSGAR